MDIIYLFLFFLARMDMMGVLKGCQPSLNAQVHILIPELFVQCIILYTTSVWLIINLLIIEIVYFSINTKRKN